jgi:hypothetical protein
VGGAEPEAGRPEVTLLPAARNGGQRRRGGT